MSTPSTEPRYTGLASGVPAARDPFARARQLHLQLRYHANRYYNEDAPVIGDGQYDTLLRELRCLEVKVSRLPQPRFAHSTRRRRPR